ncbi:unnamed protein product [Rotaria socialis]|uniref:Uncharacterized protein n=1 Tax=Rotaria socialis TaxID=392032 RepID=A0A817R861_9BILA|nr:unnamed protein product [Rotaria socialis]CAF4408140.1 unnamed protein product [Rotaria socialis]
MPLSTRGKYLYNMYFKTALITYIVLAVSIYVIIFCLGKYWCKLFYWIIEGLFEIKVSNIDENEEHTENIETVAQPNANESVESPNKTPRSKVLIDFYGKKIAFENKFFSSVKSSLLFLSAIVLNSVSFIFIIRFIIPVSTKIGNGYCPPYDVTDCFKFTLGQDQPDSYIPCYAEEKVNTTFNSTIVCYWWAWKNYDVIDFIERIGVCFSVLYVLKYYIKLVLVVNLFANDRHKGIAAGLFVKLTSIMGLHHSIMRHQQDPSMFKRPYLRFAVLIFNLSISILFVVLFILHSLQIIGIPSTVIMLLLNLSIMHGMSTSIAFTVNANDCVALLKGPRNISPTTISISDNNRTEELQFETDVALTRKARRKRSRQVAPDSGQNGTHSTSHTIIPLEQLEQRL